MKWLAALAVVSLAACEQAADPNPISPGGGGGTGTGTTPDAAMTSGDGGSMTSGRVCLLTGLPSLAMCATTGAGGLQVTLGNDSTLTAADGSFMLPATASGTVWSITGANIKTSVIKFGSPKLPAIKLLDYQDMVVAMNAIEVAGDGALMTRITRMGVPVAGATVVTSPPADLITYYDGQSALDWGTQSTGAAGVAWIPSLQPVSTQVTITAGQTQKVITGNSVVAGAVTFVFAEIP